VPAITRVEGTPRKCRLCSDVFHLCTSCDSGYWYCSDICRKIGRQVAVKSAIKKYRETERGREKHRIGQIRYRAKLKTKKN
jgi:hypothetical protein